MKYCAWGKFCQVHYQLYYTSRFYCPCVYALAMSGSNNRKKEEMKDEKIETELTASILKKKTKTQKS